MDSSERPRADAPAPFVSAGVSSHADTDTRDSDLEALEKLRREVAARRAEGGADVGSNPLVADAETLRRWESEAQAAHDALVEERPGARQMVREIAEELSRQAKNDISTVDKTGKKVRRFDYPQPDTEAELVGIQERGAELLRVSQTVEELGLEGVDVQVQIAGLHEMAARCEDLARRIGMHAISEGRISQVQLSRLLGVAQLTVGRWVKDAAQPGASDSPRTD